MWIVKYRKPEHHKNYYPWQHEFTSPEKALDFIEDLGPEYDYLLFKSTNLEALKEAIINA